jgi:hypothetical protein
LRQAWTDLGLARVPLDVLDCPDRRLTRAAVQLVAETLADGDTEVTVLLPRTEHYRFWHRLLHDRTADAIADALADFPHANVTFVPYHLGRRFVVEPPQPDQHHKASGPTQPPPPAGVELPANCVPIGSVHHRDRVTVAGRVKGLRVQPRAGVAALQCTLADETGEITVVFLGRRQVAGIEPGAFVLVSGMVGERAGRLEILNPDYELLTTAGHI